MVAMGENMGNVDENSVDIMTYTKNGNLDMKQIV